MPRLFAGARGRCRRLEQLRRELGDVLARLPAYLADAAARSRSPRPVTGIATDGAAFIAYALRDGALPVGEEHGLPLLRFPLAQTAAAHEAVEGDAVGKVLVDVASQGSGVSD